MGRPIQKKFFTAKTGSIAGDLTLNVGTGPTAEAVIKQTGTGVYQVASGRVKLVDTGVTAVDPDPSTGTVGTATLTLDGIEVRKINQYLLYHFDGSAHQWRDTDGNTIGTFVPAFTADPGTKVTATGTVVMDTPTIDTAVISVTIDDGGKGYATAPTVTFSTGDGATPVTATGTAVLTGDAVTSIAIVLGGSYAAATTATVTITAP